jgi:hypothetical protein
MSSRRMRSQLEALQLDCLKPAHSFSVLSALGLQATRECGLVSEPTVELRVLLEDATMNPSR